GFSRRVAAPIPPRALLLHHVPVSRDDRSPRTAGREPRAGRRYQGADGLPALADKRTRQGAGSCRACRATRVHGGRVGRDTSVRCGCGVTTARPGGETATGET